MSSDEHLALRAAEGDRGAFEQIYSRYHQGLYRFCLAMVGNPQDAQDALQNTMVKVLRNLPGEKREIRLKPWLYRIARNESIEALRKRRDNAELEPQQGAVTGPGEAAEARERLRTLLADLDQLPERQRATLVMRELSGFDFEQIGATFDTSAAVARQTLYEARLSLRQLEAGREMACADVMRELSDADGRVARRREIRSHLRGCSDCRAFRDEIGKRHRDFAALASLPLAVSTGVLRGVMGGKAASGLSSAIGVGAGEVAATSAVVKTVATVAVVAAVGVSVADRGGLIDVPLAGDGRHSHVAGGGDAQRQTDGGQQVDPGSVAANGASTTGVHRASNPSYQGIADPRPSLNGQGHTSEPHSAQAAVDDDDTSSSEDQHTSEPGANPPGGGYGRSASSRHGRPEQHPAAAAHGQQTASAHKPERAKSGAANDKAPPGSRGKSEGSPSSQGGGKKTTPPGHAEPKQPPANPPGQVEQAPTSPGENSSDPSHGKGQGH